MKRDCHGGVMHAKANESPAALLPCPFCGGDAYFERTGTQRRSCIVSCTDCGARHESSDEGDRSGSSWNRRATTAPGASESRGGAPDNPRCGEERYELDAYIWRRDSTKEWVLELSGTINDCTFIDRHIEPLTTKPEDVAGLPSLYASPTPPAVSNGEPTAEHWKQAVRVWKERNGWYAGFKLEAVCEVEALANELCSEEHKRARSAAAKGEGQEKPR